MQTLKKLSLAVLVLGYLLAGANHFVHPQGYINIIPAYLPAPVILNYLAGFFEIAFALLLIRPETRKVASFGIIMMLVAFMPVHVTMLINSPLRVGNLLVTPAIAWVRLVLQPVLMLWAWWHRK